MCWGYKKAGISENTWKNFIVEEPISVLLNVLSVSGNIKEKGS